MIYSIDILAKSSFEPKPGVIRTIRLEGADADAVAKRLRQIMQAMPGWAPKDAGFQVRENDRVVLTWFDETLRT